MTDLYLRDLSGSLRDEVERDIRKHRLDLAAVLDYNASDDCECETDIIVGELFKINYRAV